MPKPLRDADILRQVGLRLRAAREVIGLDQRKFAEAIGTTDSALGNWERGERLADVLAMTRMLTRLGITLEWVYSGQLRGMDYDIGQQLTEAAARLGAVVGAPALEWPMKVENQPGLLGSRRPGSVPRRRSGNKNVLHEPQTPLINLK
jgi:transcriptional regulator with XRE-family HTH domain